MVQSESKSLNLRVPSCVVRSWRVVVPTLMVLVSELQGTASFQLQGHTPHPFRTVVQPLMFYQQHHQQKQPVANPRVETYLDMVSTSTMENPQAVNGDDPNMPLLGPDGVYHIENGDQHK